MRVQYFLALAKGKEKQIIDAIPNLKYQTEIDNGFGEIIKTRPMLIYTKGKYILQLYVSIVDRNVNIPGRPSSGDDQKWTIIFLTPSDIIDTETGNVFHDWKAGTIFFRKLKRMVLSDQNQNAQNEYHIQGPWSIQEVIRKAPNFAEKWCYPQRPILNENKDIIGYERVPNSDPIVPHVIAGDEPEYMARIDYNPTDDEVNDDIEIEEKNIIPIIEEESLPSRRRIS